MSENSRKTQQESEKINKNASGEELVSRVIEQENADDPAAKKEREEAYNAYVKQVTPTYSLPLHMVKAFLVGGAICLAGQLITSYCMNARWMDQLTAGKWTSLILVLASAILTGLNIYPSLAQFAGAGVLVPITGFANSVAAPAIEYQKEGQVMGIGCKIFTIAGPVILYGIFSSWVLGVGYWIWKILKVV